MSMETNKRSEFQSSSSYPKTTPVQDKEKYNRTLKGKIAGLSLDFLVTMEDGSRY